MTLRAVDTTGEARKRRAATISVLANLALIASELAVFLATGSLAILSDAAHSVNDLAAALLSYWGVTMASRPPDAGHHYGHAKFENLSALFQMALLALLALGVMAQVGLSLATGYDVEMPLVGLLVIGVTMVVDVVMSRYLMKVGSLYGSYALQADALHFASDLWAKGAVVVGLLGVAIGLWWLDSAGALVVALIMLALAIRLGWRASHSLIDAAPPGVVEAAVHRILAQETKGLRYHSLRLRQSGIWVCLDVALDLPDDASLKDAHELACRISRRIQEEVPQVRDAVIYVEPEGHHQDCPNGPPTASQ